MENSQVSTLSFLPPTRTLEGKLRRGSRTYWFY